MIPNEEKERWHYLAVKEYLDYSMEGNNDDFYFLNCLHSFRKENKLKSNEKVCKNKTFCGITFQRIMC